MHSHHPSVRWLLLLIPLLVPAAPARSQTTAPEPGSELTVSILTMQYGDAVFEKFGHNTIRVRDAYAGTDYVYHWGVFDFDQKDFFLNYALGRMDYSMAREDFADQIRWYGEYQDRTIWEQELNLTPAQRLKLRDSLLLNLLPENATYRYNYYTDNCSTRVRDAVDNVIDDAIEKQLTPKATGVTFRWHTRRCTRTTPFWYAVLHSVLGPATDRPINAWEECFLPPKLRENLAAVTITDASGATVPLVKSERVLYAGTRPPDPATPPNWAAQFFLVGLAIAGVLVALAHGARRARAGRIAFAIAATLIAALIGLAAATSLWLWLGSAHWAAWRNENLLGFSPLALPLAALLPALFARRPRLRAAARHLAIAIAALTILGLLLTPLLPQTNLEPMAFILPINVALAWCVWRLTRDPAQPQPAATSQAP